VEHIQSHLEIPVLLEKPAVGNLKEDLSMSIPVADFWRESVLYW